MSGLSGSTILSSALGTAMLIACTQAQAASVERVPSASAVAHCQAALPIYDAQLRKRPLALQNEGTTDVFVTCVLPTEGTAYGTAYVFMYLITSADEPRTVTCTLVNGLPSPFIRYIPKSVVVPVDAVGPGKRLHWYPSDNDDQVLANWVQLSCRLPPGIGIGHLGKQFDEEIGD